ncbi:MAG TPA: response regulator [Acidiferrobacteraceae bacterium]|nr:response regulator [Acidiferrobacteraceae bacterium]
MKNKIARKLITYTIFFSSAITLIITALQLYGEFRYDVKGINQKLEQIKISYIEGITHAVWLSDRKQIRLILEGITELSDIAYSEVMSTHSKKIKSGSIPKGDSIEFKVDLRHPYNNNNIYIGKFSVVASLVGVYDRLLKRLWVILLSNALKTTLVAVFIYFIFARLVTRHLSHISEFTLNDTTSTLENPLSLDRTTKKTDEFEIVVSSINKLRRRLHEHIEDLNQQKLYLSQTLHSIGDAVITTDIKGNITRMNPIAEQLTGWVFEEANGRPLKDVFPIIDATTREPMKNPVESVMATGKVIYLSNHTTLVSRNGVEYQIADSAAPIRDKDQILGMVLVFNDVTEQYQLREVAAKNKRDLQSVMDNYPAVIYIRDTNGLFTFINKEFEKRVHIKYATILGKTLYDIFPRDIADEMQHNDSEVLSQRCALESEEVAPIEDELHTFQSIKFPLFDGDDNIYAVCGISTDVTERKKQAEQLKHAQKMDALGKLTGGIAHDYNNLLGIIMGYAEQLANQPGQESRAVKYIYNIQRATERGTKLTKKLLAFSRQKTPDATVLDINELLREQRLMLEKTLTAKIKLTLDLATGLWPAWLDSSDLEDVIINMGINAMHAMEGGGELTIRTSNEQLNAMEAGLLHLAAGDYVVLSIIDTGCGMDNATKERIFDPFYTTKGEQGTGLGLSQAYGFVERSGGVIKVNSEPGRGSNFTLYFPRTHKTISNIPTPAVKTARNPKGNECLLVVDDEQALVGLAYEILTAHGYRVLTANDGEQALEILEKEAVDLIITDVIMPNMGGYQLAAKVKQQYPHIKLQMVSGFADDQENNMANDALHQNMLPKPYTSNLLLARVRSLLDERDTKEILTGRTIMVVDDERDVRELFKLNLERLGCNAILACNGDEATALYQESLESDKPVDAVILDLSIPDGKGGKGIAEEIRTMDPNAKIIIASGYSWAPEMTHYQNHGFQAALEKNFNREEIKSVLEQVLSSS